MCWYSGCPNKAFCKGLCKEHYQQQHAGRVLKPLQNVERQSDREVLMFEFRREQIAYELQLSRDAYRCAITVAARLFHKREIARLERLTSGNG